MYNQTKEEDLSKIIYYLPLDNSGRPKLASDQILQAQRNSIIRIELMNGLEITNQIKLISNAKTSFPFELQEKILLQKNINNEDFSEFIFVPTEISTSIIYEVELTRTGSILFFFLYNDPTNNERSTIPFYVTVLPKVIIQGREIKLEDIQLQTILSKSLGKITEFEKYFIEASKLKYNFVHFTPIQQLGISESLYCLRDNTKLNNIFFDSENLSEKEKTKLMLEQLDKGRDFYGIGSFVDIVLNHASDNSEWLENHPECGYNLENSPWLNCAYEFDRILQEYSNAFCDCKTSRKCQPYVTNDGELNDIMGDLWNIVNKANLHEFFLMNIQHNKKILNDFYEEFNKKRNKYTHQINQMRIGNDNEAMEYIFNNCLDEIGYARNGVKINAEKFGCCLIKLFNYNVNNRNHFFGKAEHFMIQCNERWKKRIPDWINGGMNNIRGGMHWEFIQNHNKAVRRKKPLISPYFVVFDQNDKSKIFACNGWVGQSEDPNNPAPNFTEKGTYYYFKRKINIWSDCPKLNYGNSIGDCPYLIKHMTKYVQQMAKMFNGFRLDNAHSTPIFIAEYLAEKAREVNPDLIIMAELFTKKEKETVFVNRIGINLLIRELIWCGDARNLSAIIHRFGGGYDHMLGKIEENKFDYVKNDVNVTLRNMKYLLPSLPHSIIFDLTHDNETYYQKMNNLSLNLTNMACNSFSSTAIGTTRGFDQLFPIQPSVVNEQRKYAYDDDFNNMFIDENPQRFAIKKEEKKDEPKELLTKFDFRCNYADRVDLALSCRGWKPDVNLKRMGGDFFSTEITLKNNQKILYKYVINGKNWVCDDTKPKEDDGKGNVNNVIILGNSNKSRSNNNSDSLGLNNNNQKEFHKKDLKILRRQLNAVRADISLYKNEFFLHQENQFLCIFRTFVPEENYLENIPNYDGYALICRTGYDQGGTNPTRVELPGIYSEFICGSTMGLGKIDVEGFKRRPELYGTDSDVYFTKDGKWLNNFTYITHERGRTIINFNSNMPCNSAVILKFKLTDEVRNALVNIEELIAQMNNDWKNLTQNVDLCDINLVLFKCDKEELDNTKGQRGTYAFENFGHLCYAGISHLHKKLNEFKLNKQNNTILDNIRSGDWLLDYTINRYKDQPNLGPIYNILTSILGNYRKLYVHHKPVYITKIIDSIYNIMIMKLYDLMKNKEIINFSPFSRLLLNAIPQFNGYIESSRFKHNTELPLNKLSLSAGLPHFSVEYMRCWGRDTFISFNGLFLIPGLFKEARTILLNYASVMRHGLIPNLLDSGINCRYNARDATWFFLKSVVDYVEKSRDYDIFNFGVNMVFLSDDFNEHNAKKNSGEKKTMKLAEIVHEILQKHVRGISFREWRAGKEIDGQMTDEGFNIKIYFNEENGFIYGGNKWNCGTWMDKMGSSDKAKNKGHPATPRNGADCEIIGLLYYTLVHLNNLNKEGKYPFNEVYLNNGRNLKYSEWAIKIKNNFEKYFFIERRDNNSPHDNTYKDYISDDNDLRHESQLRPNIFITLAVAPELFDKNHAINFMKVAEQFLIVNNCVGVRTLDNTDKNYNGNYDVSNDSDNYHIAHGLNYHNGPEWVWPSGFYLISKILFNDNEEKIYSELCKRLIPFELYIQKDKWSGLPELTNKDGAFCAGSCPTQAWSIATLIEALDELSHKPNFFENSTNFTDRKKKKIRKKNDEDKYREDESDITEHKRKKKKISKKSKKSKRDEDREDYNVDNAEEENQRTNDLEKEGINDSLEKKHKKSSKKTSKHKVLTDEPNEEAKDETSTLKKKKIYKKKKIETNQEFIPFDYKIPETKVKKGKKEEKEEKEEIEEIEEKEEKEEKKEKKKKKLKKKKSSHDEVEPKKEEIISEQLDIKPKEGIKKRKHGRKLKKEKEPEINEEINIVKSQEEKIGEKDSDDQENNYKSKRKYYKEKQRNKEIKKKKRNYDDENDENEENQNDELNAANNTEKEGIPQIEENKNEVQNEENEEQDDENKNVEEEEHEPDEEKEEEGIHIQKILKKESNSNDERDENPEEIEVKVKKPNQHKRNKKFEKKGIIENQEEAKTEELQEEQIVNNNEEEGQFKDYENKKRMKRRLKKESQKEEEIVQDRDVQKKKKITISDIIKSNEYQNNEYQNNDYQNNEDPNLNRKKIFRIRNINKNQEENARIKEGGESLLFYENNRLMQENEKNVSKNKLRGRNINLNKNEKEQEEQKQESEENQEEEIEIEEEKEEDDNDNQEDNEEEKAEIENEEEEIENEEEKADIENEEEKEENEEEKVDMENEEEKPDIGNEQEKADIENEEEKVDIENEEEKADIENEEGKENEEEEEEEIEEEIEEEVEEEVEDNNEEE